MSRVATKPKPPTPAAKVVIHCAACGVEHGATGGKSGPRLPGGWKRDPNEQPYCAACWHARYVLRAVTIPIAAPASSDWKELRERLREAWGESRRLANWALRKLYAADQEREPGQQKLGKAPQVYLYPEAREFCPALPPQSVVSILRAVERKYRAKRYEVLWTGAASLPNHRYPQPLPVHNSAWSFRRGEDKEPLLSFRIGGERIAVRLRGGAGFARQLRALDKLDGGGAIAGELSIYRRKDAETGRSDTLAKCVLWLPREARRERLRAGTLAVFTGRDGISAGLPEDEQPWLYDLTHLASVVIGHGKRLRAWSRQYRSENAGLRKKIAAQREAACAKYRHRIDSLTHEATAALVKHAERRGVLAIEWDDSDRSLCEGLPWNQLRQKLADKCNLAEIALTFASGDVSAKTEEPLADE